MENVIYVVRSDSNSEVYDEFNFRSEAEEYALENLQDKPYITAVLVQLNDAGEVEDELDSEVVWRAETYCSNEACEANSECPECKAEVQDSEIDNEVNSGASANKEVTDLFTDEEPVIKRLRNNKEDFLKLDRANKNMEDAEENSEIENMDKFRPIDNDLFVDFNEPSDEAKYDSKELPTYDRRVQVDNGTVDPFEVEWDIEVEPIDEDVNVLSGNSLFNGNKAEVSATTGDIDLGGGLASMVGLGEGYLQNFNPTYCTYILADENPELEKTIIDEQKTPIKTEEAFNRILDYIKHCKDPKFVYLDWFGAAGKDDPTSIGQIVGLSEVRPEFMENPQDAFGFDPNDPNERITYSNNLTYENAIRKAIGAPEVTSNMLEDFEKPVVKENEFAAKDPIKGAEIIRKRKIVNEDKNLTKHDEYDEKDPIKGALEIRKRHILSEANKDTEKDTQKIDYEKAAETRYPGKTKDYSNILKAKDLKEADEKKDKDKDKDIDADLEDAPVEDIEVSDEEIDNEAADDKSVEDLDAELERTDKLAQIKINNDIINQPAVGDEVTFNTQEVIDLATEIVNNFVEDELDEDEINELIDMVNEKADEKKEAEEDTDDVDAEEDADTDAKDADSKDIEDDDAEEDDDAKEDDDDAEEDDEATEDNDDADMSDEEFEEAFGKALADKKTSKLKESADFDDDFDDNFNDEQNSAKKNVPDEYDYYHIYIDNACEDLCDEGEYEVEGDSKEMLKKAYDILVHFNEIRSKYLKLTREKAKVANARADYMIVRMPSAYDEEDMVYKIVKAPSKDDADMNKLTIEKKLGLEN